MITTKALQLQKIDLRTNLLGLLLLLLCLLAARLF